MSTRIYTRTGDEGTTSLIGGTKVPKSHLRIEAYGTIDELNSFLGLCRDELEQEDLRLTLKEIQDRLFTIGAALACDPIKEPKMRIPDLHQSDVDLLEQRIDEMTAALPPLKNFILPGGHRIVSSLHLARTVCRRAERACVRLELESLEVEAIIIRYLNRLSDYLFTLARYVALQLGVEEIAWKPRG